MSQACVPSCPPECRETVGQQDFVQLEIRREVLLRLLRERRLLAMDIRSLNKNSLDEIRRAIKAALM